MSDDEWPNHWRALDDPEARQFFVTELTEELGPGHPLYGKAVVALAQNGDDILFRLINGKLTQVHLTYANKPERPPWPAHGVYDTFEEWSKEKQEDADWAENGD